MKQRRREKRRRTGQSIPEQQQINKQANRMRSCYYATKSGTEPRPAFARRLQPAIPQICCARMLSRRRPSHHAHSKAQPNQGGFGVLRMNDIGASSVDGLCKTAKDRICVSDVDGFYAPWMDVIGASIPSPCSWGHASLGLRPLISSLCF